MYNAATDAQMAGDHARAVVLFTQAIELRPNFADALYQRALCLRKLGKNREALDDLSRTIVLLPNAVEIYRERARVYSDLGQFDRATADRNAADQLARNQHSTHERIRTAARRGLLAFRNGDYHEAANAFSEQITLTAPGSASSALYNRSVCRLLLRDKRAADDLTHYLATTPADADAYRLLGDAYRIARLPTRAEKSYSAYLTHDPTNGQALLGRTVVRLALGRYADARRDAAAVMRLLPEGPEAALARDLQKQAAAEQPPTTEMLDYLPAPPPLKD